MDAADAPLSQAQPVRAARRTTNPFAVSALAVALLPSLCMVALSFYIHSRLATLIYFSRAHPFGGLELVCYASFLLAVLLAAIARHRRPGTLSTIALCVAVAMLVFGTYFMPYLTLTSIRLG